jgi:hypothetical protein
MREDKCMQYNILAGKSEGKRERGRPRRRWERILGEQDESVWIGFIWLRIEANGGVL